MSKYIYGVCRGRHARKNKRHKNVQFVLWRKGQQGHEEDYWHDFDSTWWSHFEPYPARKKKMDRSDWIMLFLAIAISIGSAYLWWRFFLN